mgnify:CR=1 FL=1|jgi:hypothetical protein
MEVFCGVFIISPSYILNSETGPVFCSYYSLFADFIHFMGIGAIWWKIAYKKGNPVGY